MFIGRRLTHAAVLLSKFRQPGVYHSNANAKGSDPYEGMPREAGLARRSQGTSREEQPPATNTTNVFAEGLEEGNIYTSNQTTHLALENLAISI